MAITEIEKNKKYLIRVYYRDHLDRPRDKKKTILGTLRDAQRVELEIYDSINDNVDYDPTFNELFIRYIESKVGSVTEESIRKYNELYNKYLVTLSRRKVSKMKPIIFLEWRNNLESIEGSITQKNKAIYLLKSVTKFGNEYLSIDDNAKKITALKKRVRDKFVYNTLTPEQFDYILSFEPLEVYRLLYEVYYWAGLRRGEALALFRNDLLDTQEIDIYNSVNNNKELGPPKNESSYRRVKIHEDLFNRLLPYKNSKGMYLLGSDEPLAPTTVNRRFKETIERANKNLEENNEILIPHIRIHDLRHSHATVLASNGVPISAISARLGHSSINETMNTYIHLFKGDDDRVIEAINSIIASK